MAFTDSGSANTATTADGLQKGIAALTGQRSTTETQQRKEGSVHISDLPLKAKCGLAQRLAQESHPQHSGCAHLACTGKVSHRGRAGWGRRLK